MLRKQNQEKQKLRVEAELKAKEEAEKHIPQVPTALFFQYNTQLGPPYHVLVDTNFINFSIKNKVILFSRSPSPMLTLYVIVGNL